MFEIFRPIGNLHKRETDLIETIEFLKAYVSGELEMDLEHDGWYAKDYREEYEQAYPIKHPNYADNPVITVKEVEENRIDVRKCCDKCNVAYVG